MTKEPKEKAEALLESMANYTGRPKADLLLEAVQKLWMNKDYHASLDNFDEWDVERYIHNNS